MLWWGNEANLPSDIHVLCWLPGNVSIRVLMAQISQCELMQYYRIILGTLRDKGNCPCPRCLILKLDFHQLGILTDLSARLTLVWTYLWNKIDKARWAIYQLGVPLKGVAVEHLLRNESLIPTIVRPFCTINFQPVAQLVLCLELFCQVPWTVQFQHIHIPCARGGSTTRVWAWSGQDSPQTPDMPHSCNRSQSCEYSEW